LHALSRARPCQPGGGLFTTEGWLTPTNMPFIAPGRWFQAIQFPTNPMFRYRLRTLLIVLALCSVLFAGISCLLRPRPVWSVDLNGGKQIVVFKARPSLWSRDITQDGD